MAMKMTQEKWVLEWLEKLSQPLTAEQARQRRKVIDRILKKRGKADIRPDRVEDYIREIREGGS